MEVSRAGKWMEDHVFLIDCGFTVLLAIFLVPIAGYMGTDDAGSQISRIFALIQVGAIAWRRTQPVVSAVVVLSAALVHFIFEVPELSPADLVVYIALYSVTAYGPRWAGITGIISTLGGALLLTEKFVVIAYYANQDQSAILLVGGLVFAGIAGSLLAVWAVALIRRAKVTRMREIIEHAKRLEFERDQQAVISAQSERTLIAREMHDVVAHSLSVIIAQADGGRYSAGQDPQAAIRALTTIAETGRAALADTRRILGVLRTRPTSVEQQAPITPQPDNHDIFRLVEHVRTTGLKITYTVLGQPRALPPAIGLASYRICQESLTNVLKHAGPNPQVIVTVIWQDTDLILHISDDGRGATSSSKSDGVGQGLIGIHERAALFDGTVTTGPRAGGGFEVHATIPIPPKTPYAVP